MTKRIGAGCGLLDGVFNHVGPDFPRDRDGWLRDYAFEGHGDLITLNHHNPQVVDYTVDVMSHWLERGGDGWRLDAAYAVPSRFWATVLPRVRERHPDAWFVGELIHGDYAAIVRDTGFDSVTQYELWKAIWSSLNDGNFYELDWALQPHNTFLESFAPLTFIGNHDVTRIASRLEQPDYLAHALVLLMTVGGIPSVYAGDELGYRGVKEESFGGDDAVRPEFGSPPAPVDAHGAQVLALHQYLIGLRRRHPWLHAATTSTLRLDNRHYVYRTQRAHFADDALIVALNLDDTPLRVRVPRAQIIAGSGAPPEEVVDVVMVEPGGWRIMRPI